MPPIFKLDHQTVYNDYSIFSLENLNTAQTGHSLDINEMPAGCFHWKSLKPVCHCTFHVTGVCLASQSAAEKHNRVISPQAFAHLVNFCKKIVSYFDCRINKSFAYSRCVICVNHCANKLLVQLLLQRSKVENGTQVRSVTFQIQRQTERKRLRDGVTETDRERERERGGGGRGEGERGISIHWYVEYKNVKRKIKIGSHMRI